LKQQFNSTAMSGQNGDTRTRLLEAAGEVFAEKGYRAATIREICRRAGANVAAVNYYFGDKKALYVAVVGYAHGSQTGLPLPHWPEDAPAEQRLRLFIEQTLAAHFEEKGPPWKAQLMLRELTEPTEACVALVDAFVRPRAMLLQRILNDLLPPETSQTDRFLIAFSIVGQCLFHRAKNPVAELLTNGLYRQFDVRRLADHITRFTLAALGRAEPLGRRGQPGGTAPIATPTLAESRRE